jgi:FG-GAP-like repeat/Tachylectin
MRRFTILHGLVVVSGLSTVLGCALPSDDVTDHESELSGAARKPRSEAIRDIAASRGLGNGVLLAGIAQVETGLSHCWSEATWACQGPFSSYCGGPVIAGAGDGPCSAQQGGLGMFQFDGGTYAQTLARDGQGILQLDGNIAHAVDFVAGIVRQEVAGVNSNADAIAWMNSVPVVQGNARFNQWTAILACRYNGRCSGTSGAQQAALYGNATLAALGEFGAGFWQVTAPAGRPRVLGADLSGDRFADLLGIKPDGTLWYYRNAGAASPDAPFSSGTLVGTGWNIFSKVFAADIDGDAFADLVAMKPDGTLWHYHNAATANPSSPFSTGAQIGSGWSIYSVVFGADIDGDDYTDAVGLKPDGTLWFYRNSHSTGAPFSTGTLIGTGWNIF